MAAKQTPVVSGKSVSTYQGEVSRMVPLQHIPLKKIRVDDGFNARETTGLDKDSMFEFAENIMKNGMINPVTVKPTDDGFMLIAGFRRTKAARMLGWETIPATILPADTTEQEARIKNVAENVVRDDLSLYEKCKAYNALLVAGVAQKEIISRLGSTKSQSTIDNCIRIFKGLDPAIKKDWADPKSAVGRKLSFAWLVDLVRYPVRATKPGEVSQMQRLATLQGEGDPAAIAKLLGSGEEGKPGAKKAKAGKFVRVRRDWLTKAMNAAEKPDLLTEETLAGMSALCSFILGKNGGKLLLGSLVIYDPTPKADGKAKRKGGRKSEAQKAAEKAKAEKAE